MFSPMESYSHNESFDGLFDKVKKAAKKVTSTARKVVSATPIGAAGRAIDLTASKSLINRALPSGAARVVQKYAKQAVATSAVALTGGAVLLARRDLVKPAIGGFKTGAMIGGAIAGGKTASAVNRLSPWGTGSNPAEAIPTTPALPAVASRSDGMPSFSTPVTYPGSPVAAADEALAQTMAMSAGGDVPVAVQSGTPATGTDAAQSAVASAAAGAAPASGVSKALPLAAAAGAGFLVFGPIGAVAGAAAGAFLGRKKA